MQASAMWGLVVRQLWKRMRRRLRGGPVWRWRYSGRTPERVLIAPPDLRLADPQIASEIYHGRFALAGQVVDTGGQSPFLLAVRNAAWVDSLHGFRWLRHMRASGTELAAANARALVTDWIGLHGRRITTQAWEPALVARRIIAWLQHSPVILQGAEYPFYRMFLKSLAVQIRYLRAMAPEMMGGEEKLRARIALCFAALSLPSHPAALRSATRHLTEEIERQILPDGGHVSRSPLAILELLADLLPLRQTYANQSETPPAAMISAIDRMLPALRFFRHQDGTLARFNGMGITIHDRVTAILRHDDTGAQPLRHAPHSGYERMVCGGTTIIADTGPAPAVDVSGHAHAGCLSFEMSCGRRHFIVNAGIDSFGSADVRPLARATAAHSTATLNDTSSARFNHAPGINSLIGSPLVSGPRHVTSRRIDDSAGQGFVANHDGYVSRFGLIHEREIRLSTDGTVLQGADRFHRPGGTAPKPGSKDHVALRFHLHPEIEIYRDADGRLLLAGREGDGWTFEAPGLEPAVEESIFFAGLTGPRRTRQIALHVRVADFPEVEWRLIRTRLKGQDQEAATPKR